MEYLLQASDIRDAEKGFANFKELPRSASILDTSVITTLYYCCLYHYELSEVSYVRVNFIITLHCVMLCDITLWCYFASQYRSRFESIKFCSLGQKSNCVKSAV